MPLFLGKITIIKNKSMSFSSRSVFLKLCFTEYHKDLH